MWPLKLTTPTNNDSNHRATGENYRYTVYDNRNKQLKIMTRQTSYYVSRGSVQAEESTPFRTNETNVFISTASKSWLGHILVRFRLLAEIFVFFARCVLGSGIKLLT